MIANRTRFAALALIAAVYAGSAVAAPEGADAKKEPKSAAASEAKPASGPRTIAPILKALDIDGDGKVSAEEITKSAESLKSLDKNADGAVSGDEVRPANPNAEAGGKKEGKGKTEETEGEKPKKAEQTGRMRGALGLARVFDTDKDQTISAAEIAKAPEVLTALDKDKDGSVSRDELYASMRPEGRGGEAREKGEKKEKHEGHKPTAS